MRCCSVFKVVIFEKQQSITNIDREQRQLVRFKYFLYFQTFSEKNNIFWLKEFLRMKGIGSEIAQYCNSVFGNYQRLQ